MQGRIRNGIVYGKDLEFDIAENNTGAQRKDMIVLDCSLVRRDIQARYIEGSTELIRNDDVFQLKLAEISVNPGATGITQANILDTRLNKEVCGMMYAVVDNVDTTDIFNQYLSYLEQKQTEWDAIQADETSIWQSQTETQQSDFDTQLTGQRLAWEEFWAVIHAELERYATFDFDNLANLKGVTRTTPHETDSEIMEEIRITAGGLLIASRHTISSEDNGIETIISTEKVFDSDGVTILRRATITTTIDEDGNITEVVSA